MTGTFVVGGRMRTRTGFEPATIGITGDTIGSVTGPVVDRSVVDGTVVGERIIDATGLMVAPGFVDLQINGGFDIDLTARPETIWDLGRQLPQHGVTSFCPTIISSPRSTVDAALHSVAHRPADHVGAEPLGLHLEGPMLSPERLGTHPVAHLRTPSSDLIRGWSRDRGVALVTMAPELPEATTVIAELVARGVTVAAGHTNATAAQARAGIDAGITMVTHLFNAMAPFHHRSPNLAGLTLADPDLAAGLIVDGVHLDPVAVAAVWNAKRPETMALVTDAVAAMSRPSGTYQLGGQTITAADDRVHNDSGDLAGSVLTMDRAIRNLIAYTNCEPHQALAAAAATPARLIDRPDRGVIEAGAIADLVLLDQKLEVQLTICAGRLAYIAEAARGRVPPPNPETP